MINWNLKTVLLEDLHAYEKNPRILTERHQRLLSDSLDKFGLVEKPIVNADLTIIGGHQRIEVLSLKGAKEIEVWYPDRELSDKEVEEFNIVLNKVSGEFDYDTLANQFDIGDLLNWGFDEDDLGLEKPMKVKKPDKAIISLEFSDKETMMEYIQQCEEISQQSAAKMKIKG